jgi:hypothetical protein
MPGVVAHGKSGQRSRSRAGNADEHGARHRRAIRTLSSDPLSASIGDERKLLCSAPVAQNEQFSAARKPLFRVNAVVVPLLRYRLTTD